MPEGKRKPRAAPHMNNILIISGGSFKKDRMESYLKKNKYDHIIAADSGGEYAASLGLIPDLLLGDFDSVSNDTLDYFKSRRCRIKEFDPEKDMTDFDLALNEAVSLSPERITVIGGTGTRLDHTFTSIFCLFRGFKKGIYCEMSDPHNKIYFKDNDFKIKGEEQYGKYVSLVPVTESVILSIKGMKYPLDERKVFMGESLCQSNEIVCETAEIKVKGGVIAVFESMD